MPRKENQSNSNADAALDGAALGPIRSSGKGPLYMHVYRRLARLIDSGSLVEGARLPPSRFLAAQLAVSRFTVAYAYGLLAADGYIVGRGRAGTFVRPALSRSARAAADTGPRAPDVPARISVAGSPLFSVGLAPVEFFPRKVWVNLVKRRLAGLALGDLLPGDPQGSLLLRRALANRLAITRGIACAPEHLFVTRGIAGATALVAAAMVERGDRVLVEDPADPRCFDALRAAGAELSAVTVDADGMRVEDGIAACAQPRLWVVTPACQFPMGVALSATRRSLLLKAARTARTYVLEHDIQADYRFSGPSVRSLASEDGMQTVIHALHLSEIVFPALAVSCVAVPSALVPRFRAACERLPPPSDPAEQAALVDLVRHGHILRYFNTAFAACARRREALRQAFADLGYKVYVPDAGLHLLAALERPLDDTARDALRELAMAPAALERYSLTARWPPALAVGFAAVPEGRAREAVLQLSEIVRLAR